MGENRTKALELLEEGQRDGVPASAIVDLLGSACDHSGVGAKYSPPKASAKTAEKVLNGMSDIVSAMRKGRD